MFKFKFIVEIKFKIFMKKLLRELVVESWKTTVAGVILAIISGLVAVGKITPTQGTEVIGFAGSIGFAFSKDADKTGFKAVQSSELQVAEEALTVAKATGNAKIIEMAQAAVDALKNPPIPDA